MATNISQRARNVKQAVRIYYLGKRAASYNRTWQAFSEKTLAAARSIIDLSRLQNAARAQERSPRILDAACGTGLLLEQLARLVPDAELYGMDASGDMLIQAQQLLAGYPRTHFARLALKGGEMAALPYKPAFFDLITCTNAFHYLDDPVAILRGLANLLAPQGQLVIEDYARRPFPFPWSLFEWSIRRVDPQHIRAYTLQEAQRLCQSTGLQVVAAKRFPIDLLWQGWAMRTV